MVPLPTARTISERELAVLAAALEHAATGHSSGYFAEHDALCVDTRCESRCPSVEFAVAPTSSVYPIADGLAMEHKPDDVGILVRRTDNEAIGLEIHSARGQEVRESPSPCTIRSFESAGKARLK